MDDLASSSLTLREQPNNSRSNSVSLPGYSLLQDLATSAPSSSQRYLSCYLPVVLHVTAAALVSPVRAPSVSLTVDCQEQSVPPIQFPHCR